MTSQKDTHHPENGSNLTPYDPERPLNAVVRLVTVDEDGLMAMLLKLKYSERFITDLAEKLGVSAQYLGDVISGRARFGPKLLKGLGVVRAYRMFDVEIVMDEGNSE